MTTKTTYGYCPVCEADRASVNGRCCECYNSLMKLEYNPENLRKHRGYNVFTKKFLTEDEVMKK